MHIDPDDDQEHVEHYAAQDADERRGKAAKIGDDRIVEEWPCRRCGEVVATPQIAVEMRQMFNRTLARRGEVPISTSEVMLCPSCAQAARDEEVRRAANDRAKAAQAIAIIRDSVEPTDLERLAPSPAMQQVVDAERTLRRLFGGDGDEMIRAHRSAKNKKRKGPAI